MVTGVDKLSAAPPHFVGPGRVRELLPQMLHHSAATRLLHMGGAGPRRIRWSEVITREAPVLGCWQAIYQKALDQITVLASSGM